MADPGDGGDLLGGEQPAGAFDRADKRRAGSAAVYPLHVVGGFSLRDPDPGGQPGHGVLSHLHEMGRVEIGLRYGSGGAERAPVPKELDWSALTSPADCSGR